MVNEEEIPEGTIFWERRIEHWNIGVCAGKKGVNIGFCAGNKEGVNIGVCVGNKEGFRCIKHHKR